jgi:hypothetical protein
LGPAKSWICWSTITGEEQDRTAAAQVGVQRRELALQEALSRTRDDHGIGVVGHTGLARQQQRRDLDVLALERVLDARQARRLAVLDAGLAVADHEVDLAPGRDDAADGARQLLLGRL